jgi:hypothetical protein
MAYKTITDTFLDEITHDIASQNWGENEWTAEFDTMAEAGIDTVVLIRARYRERLAYPSAVVSKHVRTLPVFPPIDSRKLIYKLETVQPYVSKVITFEFSHFMSPNSMWPSARMFYRRHRELVATRRTRGGAGTETTSERNQWSNSHALRVHARE